MNLGYKNYLQTKHWKRQKNFFYNCTKRRKSCWICAKCHWYWHFIYGELNMKDRVLNRIRTYIGLGAESKFAFELSKFGLIYKNIIDYYRLFKGKGYSPILSRELLLQKGKKAYSITLP